MATIEDIGITAPKPKPAKLFTVGLDFEGECLKCKESVEILERYDTERGWVFIKEHSKTKSQHCRAS